MLKAAGYWSTLPAHEADAFRFHHISTGEVFGSLGDTGRFDEDTPYDPRSLYSASKAGSDHLVSAWGHSSGLPVLVTNCSNNQRYAIDATRIRSELGWAAEWTPERGLEATVRWYLSNRA